MTGERFCDAIRRRAVLGITYKGMNRVVEPHGHGTTSRGIEVLLVYQRSGGSSSGSSEGWKTLRVTDIEHVVELPMAFLVRPDADRDARELGTVHCFAG